MPGGRIGCNLGLAKPRSVTCIKIMIKGDERTVS